MRFLKRNKAKAIKSKKQTAEDFAKSERAHYYKDYNDPRNITDGDGRSYTVFPAYALVNIQPWANELMRKRGLFSPAVKKGDCIGFMSFDSSYEDMSYGSPNTVVLGTSRISGRSYVGDSFVRGDVSGSYVTKSNVGFGSYISGSIVDSSTVDLGLSPSANSNIMLSVLDNAHVSGSKISSSSVFKSNVDGSTVDASDIKVDSVVHESSVRGNSSVYNSELHSAEVRGHTSVSQSSLERMNACSSQFHGSHVVRGSFDQSNIRFSTLNSAEDSTFRRANIYKNERQMPVGLEHVAPTADSSVSQEYEQISFD